MLELKAKPREILGKRVKVLRNAGILPAVLYGSGGKAESLSLSLKDFVKIWKSAGESTLIDLAIEGAGRKNVLIHDISFDPVKDLPLHVDFYETRADQLIRVHVPLNFIGESEAVKTLSGILLKIVHEIEVEALPKNLPHELQADLAKLAAFDDVITLSDIKLPAGVALIGDPEAVLAKVEPPRSDEELAQLVETPIETNLDAIEVAPKGKKEETEAEKSSEPGE